MRDVSIKGLTKRELEIFELLIRGLSDKEIAGSLGISHNTVRNHAISILHKSGARNRKELIVKYYENKSAKEAPNGKP